MELSSKIKGLKFMRRKEDAKERATIEASRHTSTPTIIPTRSLSSLHDHSTSATSINKEDGDKEAIISKHEHSITPKEHTLIHGTKSTLQIQYEPSLTALLQPTIHTTRLAHKDYKAPKTSETPQDDTHAAANADDMEVDEGALKREEDKQAHLKKQIHAAQSKVLHPPMKRDKKGEVRGGKSASFRKKQ
jgi:hypothetical protein